MTAGEKYRIELESARPARVLVIDWIARDLQRRAASNELHEELSFAAHAGGERHRPAVW